MCELWYHTDCLGLSFKSKCEESRYLFSCSRHKEEIENLTYRVEVPKAEMESSILDEKSTLRHARKELSGRQSTKVNPTFVEYQGNVYHISRFLSLQVGKVYCPTSSRKE